MIKDWIVSLKIENNEIISAEHWIGGPSYYKAKKRHKDQKGRNKTVLADNMIVCRKPSGTYKTTTRTTNDSNKVIKYKVNIQFTFLHTSSKQLDNRIFKNSIIIAPKKT